MLSTRKSIGRSHTGIWPSSRSVGRSGFTNHRQPRPICAIVLPSNIPGFQKYVVGAQEVDVPLGAVQQLPRPAQAAVFLSAFATIGLLTFAMLTTTDIRWTQSDTAPYVMGIIFALTGSAHFTAHDDFCSMMPTQGAWGLWYIPGSDSFHVNWTGIAEVSFTGRI